MHDERRMYQKYIDDVLKPTVAKPKRKLVKFRDLKLKEDVWMYQKHIDDVVKPEVAKPKRRLLKLGDLKPKKDARQQGISREQRGNGKENVEAYFNRNDVQQNSDLEKYSESELIEQLKGKKRKLEHLGVRAAIPRQQDINKELSQKSSMSCLVNVFESTKPSADKTIICSRSLNSSSTFNGPLLENCQGKDMVIKSKYSVIDSSPTNPHNLICPTSCEPSKKNLNSARTSKRVSNFVGDSLQKCVVPVGPRFQAIIPEFCGTFDKDTLIDHYKKNSDNVKWLGARVWPPKMGNIINVEKRVRKGRFDICQCVTPNSIDCIIHHSLEALDFLRYDLGPAFFCWKFNEMGEEVAKIWTLKEQQSFKSLIKIRPSYGKNFLKHALKSFPKKSRKEIVNYYFNVYIPRRISVETISSSEKVVDSDFEDEPKGFREKVGTTSKSKKAKDQYLRK